MTYMFEVYYAAPADSKKEKDLAEQIFRLGGRWTCREDPLAGGAETICLTFEFDDLAVAEAAAEHVRERGEHVEGPGEYGDD